MPEIHLSLSFHIIFILFAVVCSVALSVFVYRKTIPPIASINKSFLIILRSLGLFFLFMLLAEPLLSLITRSADRPEVAVLIDNSQSMAIKDKGGRRDDMLKSILHSTVWKQIDENGKIDYYLFSGKVRGMATISDDSLTLNGEATDIAQALKSIKKSFESSNLQAVVLVTDGNSTVGMNPLYEARDLGVPVFAIGIGDTSEQKDILIRKVFTNDITYVDTKVPVNVSVHSAGYDGERIRVSIANGDKIVGEQLFTLESGTRDYLIQLAFVPENEGLQKYTVEVSSLPGEFTKQNNYVNFYTKVLKNKLKIALIAGPPNMDAAFIQRSLMNDKNVEIKTFYENSGGQLPDNVLNRQALKDVDCMILAGYPTMHSSLQSIQMILDNANTGKPLMSILSRTMDFKKLRILEPVLPFITGNVSEEEVQVFPIIHESQQNNSVLKVGSGINTVILWSKLPPVYKLLTGFSVKVESDILATSRFQSASLTDPLIVARNVNQKKSIAVLGYGLWRWKMLPGADSETAQVFDNFISNSVRWLTTKDDTRKVRVQTSKNVYTTQETVEYAAQVYNDNYNPIDDAQIEVRVQHKNETNQIFLNSLGSGQYQGVSDHLQEGEYKYSATVAVNGTIIGKDQGDFSIGGLNAEFFETKMNKLLLQQISDQTGGVYYDSDDIASLANDITKLPDFKSKEIVKSAEYELWNSRWMFVSIVFIFAFEWYLRKRNGML